MSVNIKLGGNTISGVSSIKVEDADTAGTYDTFTLGGGGNSKVVKYYVMPFGSSGLYSIATSCGGVQVAVHSSDNNVLYGGILYSGSYDAPDTTLLRQTSCKGIPASGTTVKYANTDKIFFGLDSDGFIYKFGDTIDIYVVDVEACYTATGFYTPYWDLTGNESYILTTITLSASEVSELLESQDDPSSGFYNTTFRLLELPLTNVDESKIIILSANTVNSGGST